MTRKPKASRLNGGADALAGAFRKVIEEAIGESQEHVLSLIGELETTLSNKIDASADAANSNMQAPLDRLRKEFVQSR